MCPKCQSKQVELVGAHSVSDPINSIWCYECKDCKHKWEETGHDNEENK